MKKIRLDEKLREMGMNEEKILPMVMAGEIWVGTQKASSRAQMIDPDVEVIVRSNTPKYVSRGGFKLEAAIDKFGVNVEGKICADFGSSTGGFVDVLLQNGARKVYAIETGKNLLDMKIKNNPKVISMEDESLFHYEISDMPWTKNEEKIDLVTIDLSFIPLSHALNQIRDLTLCHEIIALIKPHYEAQDESLLRKGVVKDNETREIILSNLKTWLLENNFTIKEIIESPIHGGGGNVEYLAWIIW